MTLPAWAHRYALRAALACAAFTVGIVAALLLEGLVFDVAMCAVLGWLVWDRATLAGRVDEALDQADRADRHADDAFAEVQTLTVDRFHDTGGGRHANRGPRP